MPLYEYECENCSHRFEVIQKFSDAPLTECPKCGGPVRKLLSSPAIQFKGSGWYITDYAKKNSTGAGATGKSESSATSEKGSSSSGDSGSTKSDSAPASTPKPTTGS
ncbi:MAG TPA: FmdB family zinc ribbon protein [Luteitalea sp.]|nr:FmdB family zinc ribbon protein [Luteitalea sp.]